MDDKKLASSARRQINKEHQLEEIDLDKERKRLYKKMYWEEFRYNSYTNFRDHAVYIAFFNISAVFIMRSLVIFPIGIAGTAAFEFFRAWRSTPYLELPKSKN